MDDSDRTPLAARVAVGRRSRRDPGRHRTRLRARAAPAGVGRRRLAPDAADRSVAARRDLLHASHWRGTTGARHAAGEAAPPGNAGVGRHRHRSGTPPGAGRALPEHEHDDPRRGARLRTRVGCAARGGGGPRDGRRGRALRPRRRGRRLRDSVAPRVWDVRDRMAVARPGTRARGRAQGAASSLLARRRRRRGLLGRGASGGAARAPGNRPHLRLGWARRTLVVHDGARRRRVGRAARRAPWPAPGRRHRTSS